MGDEAKVDLPLKVAPSGKRWLTETARSYGVSRSALANALLAKGMQAWRAGWRPDGWKER